MTFFISIRTSRKKVRIRPVGLVLTAPRGAEEECWAAVRADERESAPFNLPVCLAWVLPVAPTDLPVAPADFSFTVFAIAST